MCQLRLCWSHDIVIYSGNYAEAVLMTRHCDLFCYNVSSEVMLVTGHCDNVSCEVVLVTGH